MREAFMSTQLLMKTDAEDMALRDYAQSGDPGAR